MYATDRLTAIVMALAAGAVFAIFVPWITGQAMAVPWPGWWAEWARSQPASALAAWRTLTVAVCWVVPAAALAWLIVRPGRLPDWRYAGLAPLPVLAWTLLLPALEGQDLHLAERLAAEPVAALLEALALYGSIPFFAWVFRLRGQAAETATGRTGSGV